MAEYIEREAAKRNKVYSKERHEYVIPATYVDGMAAADVVEVVRCKDCKHFGHNLENDTYCSADGLEDPNENNFCSYGERRMEMAKTCPILRNENGFGGLNDESNRFEEVADNLIAHGVTVQEWISVKERLPDKNGIYVTCNKRKECGFHLFLTNGRMWEENWKRDNITHWMPFPGLPKGE